MAEWTAERRREYMREYSRKWRATSPKYKDWKLRLSRRRKLKYDTDEEYRNKMMEYSRNYRARLKQNRQVTTDETYSVDNCPGS